MIILNFSRNRTGLNMSKQDDATNDVLTEVEEKIVSEWEIMGDVTMSGIIRRLEGEMRKLKSAANEYRDNGDLDGFIAALDATDAKDN